MDQAQQDLPVVTDGIDATKEKSQKQPTNHPEGKKEKKSGKDKVVVKAAKGTRDFLPLQMTIRKYAFDLIAGVFQQHGAVEIDTPIFELRETLLGQYGEEGGKLVYDLDDQGGEILSLRYDLTVPFARFVATHGIKKIKRFHIGKVYRRDNPSVQQGRYREFFQCDFDIAGENDPMVSDAELLKIIDSIFTKLDIGNHTIKVSSRKLLDSIIQIANIPEEKFKTVCSSIDKLDKVSWVEVQKELEKKGITLEQCEKLHNIVLLKGEPFELIEKIEKLNIFGDNAIGKEGMEEMKMLFNFARDMNVKHLLFDLSLARGLDYYTGMIFETVLHGTQVGSVAGGGRYDNLIGQFSSNKVPSVGASIGIERVFAILEKKLMEDKTVVLRENPSECIVASIPSKNMDMNGEKLKMCDLLWNAGFKCDLNYKMNWNLGKQLTYANDQKIPFAVVIGEDEIKSGIVKIKSLNEKKEETVEISKIVEVLRQRIQEQQISQVQFNVVKKEDTSKQQE